MSFLSIAKPLVEMGFSVFPVHRNKVPCIKNWANEATTNLAKLELWDKQFHTENAAILTGVRGLVVIDIDDIESDNAKKIIP